jgi:regulator of protease activity HflC (stomatin/prohibitin superfamily)
MRINTIYGMILIFLYFALAKLGGILWKIDPFWSVFSFIAAVACLIIGIPGFKRIKPNELGAVLLWGKPAYSVDSGIVITPFPYKLARVSKNIIELRFPDDKTQGKKSTPIQITHGTSKDASSGALGYIQKTPVSIIVRCKIIDLLEYVQEFGGYDYNDNVSTTELINRIREAVVSKMIDECRKGTLAENLKRLNEMEEKLKLEVESITKNHGVEIITTRIEDIDLGDMNKAYRERQHSQK